MPVADRRAPRSRVLSSRTSRSAASPTATATEIAMQRSPADPYAAPISASRGVLEVGVRHARPCDSSRRPAPARACRAPCRLVDVLRDRRGADEAHRRDVRMREQRIDGHAVALHHVEHAAGSPASVSSSASRSDARRILLRRLQHEEFPHAMAIGNIHSGTIAGKLNGVMPATTPSGCRIDQVSMPLPTCSENSPFSRCGMPHANSTTSMPRCTSPRASREHLAVLERDEPRELFRVPLEQRLEPKEHPRALHGRDLGPCGKRHRAAWIAARVPSALASATRAATAPVAGLNTSPHRSDGVRRPACRR